jgi:NDP-sugar pyrophosphorylase family protein
MINELFKTIATFFPHRSISSMNKPDDVFQANVTIEEVLTDELEITEHEVQQGAQISDHAYKKQSTIMLRCLYSDDAQFLSSAIFNFVTRKKKLSNDAAYEMLLEFQKDIIPLKVVTGKRTYTNVLIKTLTQVNDRDTNKVLSINIELKELFVVTIQKVTLPPREVQKIPEQTDSTKDSGKKILQEMEDVSSIELTFGRFIPSLLGN